MFDFLKRLSRKRKPPVAAKKEECDHIYWPVPDGHGSWLGQQCVLCGKFNSIADVLGQYKKENDNA